ncbi:vomeronasal type-2 receptor 26-like [Python bivittatus]|uniref:Vomeronasal type-2 receptor 26-like n=1 Tax=Python bivittatus TaxID=176946 RepID=A0A9F5J104_PYTBI|nr:vomeronasal type-2 receptor 26-like [Python bivittatus]
MLILLWHLVNKIATLSCPASDAFPVPHEWYQPGDLIIGGMVSLILYHFYEIQFQEHPSLKPYQLPLIIPKFYQHVLALAFAVKEINEDSQILPNITLGFHIYDSYYNPRMTYRTTLDLLFRSKEFVPNYKCDSHKNLMAIIGALETDTSSYMAETINVYKIPQLIYGSFAQEEFQTTKLSSLYCMVPNEDHQYIGVIQLLLRFGWKWIGVFATDNYGEHFLPKLQPLLSQNGICLAFTQKLSQRAHLEDLPELFDVISSISNKLIDQKSNAFLVYGESFTIVWLRSVVFLRDPENKESASFRKVWILMNPIDFILTGIQRNWDLQMFHGALSFSVHSREVQGFREYLQVIKPSTHKDGFLQDVWEQLFDCSFPNAESPSMINETCNGEENLEALPGPLFELQMIGHSYSIYNAVYTVAHSLQQTVRSRSKQREIPRFEFPDLQPWQLHPFLQGISFNNSAGERVFLNQKREATGGFDIINLITFPNRSLQRVRVGQLDPSAPRGKELFIDEDLIVWHPAFNQVLPLSQCNDHCSPGSWKKGAEGKQFCCYDCPPCPEGKVSNQNDMDDCFECSEDCYPNKEKKGCILKPVVFLTFEETLGIGLTSSALSFFVLTSWVAISSVLAKTITVVVAFMATKPGSPMRKWVGRRLAFSAVLSCSLFQVCICALWLSTSPPFPELDLYSEAKEIILQCNEGSSSFFYCVLGYMGILAIASFTVAFLARKLPDSFNEAKFITFSMLAFCSVWVSFVPAYLSTKGKAMVAVEVFSILSSSTALLGCIFLPKCYIIFFRPELNHREQLIRRN